MGHADKQRATKLTWALVALSLHPHAGCFMSKASVQEM